MFEVILDRGPGDAAYALGMWDNGRVLATRWNGTDENPIGTPQARGMPTWMILEEPLYDAVISMAPADRQPIAKAYLGRK